MGKAAVTTHAGLTVKEHCHGGDGLRSPGEAEGPNDPAPTRVEQKEDWYKKNQRDLTID